jgi:DDE family transposase
MRSSVSRQQDGQLDRRRATAFVESIFEDDDLHSKRLETLANGVVGTLRTGRASIHAIGQAYAEVARIGPKHGVKQVDRYLSNAAFDVWRLLPSWAAFLIGGRSEIVIALDWTDYDDDDHTTLSAYIVTRHGRASPLAWRTVHKSKLKQRQVSLEREFIGDLAKALPAGVRVVLLADRGFADQTLYAKLDTLGWDYVVRFRGYVLMEHDGRTAHASEWVPPHGRATIVHRPRITARRTEVPAVVLVHAKKMKEAWCLVTSLAARAASEVVKLYGKRFTIEETFRDQKDMRFGLGLRATHIRDPARRDRLLLLVALAHVLLTLLGAAAEAAGLDRLLKVNTSPHRTHSLFRQGSYWYGAIPNMREDWLKPLMAAFEQLVSGQPVFEDVFGAI